MSARALTERQQAALIMLPNVYSWTEGSMPSLARRGLVERYSTVTRGRRYNDWRLTEAGHSEAARIRESKRDAYHGGATEAEDYRDEKWRDAQS